MKKLMFITALLIITFSFASAELTTWDNWKSWNEDGDTVTIKDLNGDIGTAQILPCNQWSTIDNCQAPIGKDQIVMKFKIWAWEDYDNVISELRFKDMKDKEQKELTKSFEWKSLTTSYVPYEREELRCNLNITTNERYGCYNVTVTGTETKEIWDRITPADLKKNEQMVIALFVDTKEGDYVDAIPTLYGREINEWATWNSSFEVGLEMVWNFEMASGNVTDVWNNTYNGSETGTVTYQQTGINNFAAQFPGIDSNGFSIPTDWDYTTDMAISIWAKPDNISAGSPRIIDKYFDGSAYSWNLNYNTGSDGRLQGTYGSGGEQLNCNATGNLVEGIWNHLVYNYDGTDLKLYLNGVVCAELTTTVSNNNEEIRIGYQYNGGNPFKGLIDEGYIYDRSLTNEEIGLLWDGGSGTFFSASTPPVDNPPEVTLNSPAEGTNYTVNDVDFNCTASDDINLVNVSILIDGTINQTNSSGLNASNYVFTVNDLSDAQHNWSCSATDNSSQTTTPTARIFNVSVPGSLSVQLTVPADDSTASSNPENFSATISYASEILVNATLYTNQSGWGIKNTTYRIGTQGIQYQNTTTGRFTNTQQIYGSVTLNGLAPTNASVGVIADNSETTTVVTEFNYVNGTQINVTVINDGTTVNKLMTVTLPLDDMGLESMVVYAVGSTGTLNNHQVTNYTLGGFEGTTNGKADIGYAFTESVIWNVNACSATGICNFSSSNFTVYADSDSPLVEALHPTGLFDYGKAGNNTLFNWTAVDDGLNVCSYQYNSANTTVACVDNSTTFSLANAFSILFFANDTIGNQNDSTTTWSYRIFELARDVDTPVQETASVTLDIELVSNASLQNVSLNYNGVVYATTNSGNNYSTTLTAPSAATTVPIYWNITYAGHNNIITDTSQQVVSGLNFSECNAVNTVPFLHINFTDEVSTSAINASISAATFTYYLSDSTNNKSFSYNNVSEYPHFDFCGSPATETINVVSTILYTANDYTQRTLISTDSVDNTTTNKTLLLLKTADGLFTTFTTIDVATNIVPRVNAVMTRTLNGISGTIVDTGITDDSGIGVFFLNPNFPHIATFTKTGYITNSFTFTPTTDNRLVTMGQESDVEASNISLSLIYSFSPLNSTLVNNTLYDFDFIVSGNTEVTFISMMLYDQDDLLLASSTNTGIGTLSESVNTTNSTIIYGLYQIKTGSETLNLTRTWIVGNFFEGDYSFKKQATLFLDYAFADWIRYGLVLLVLIATMIFIGSNRLVDNNETKLLVIAIEIWLFSVVGWLDLPGIAEGTGITAFGKQYAIAIVTTMITAYYNLRRFFLF